MIISEDSVKGRSNPKWRALKLLAEALDESCSLRGNLTVTKIWVVLLNK